VLPFSRVNGVVVVVPKEADMRGNSGSLTEPILVVDFLANQSCDAMLRIGVLTYFPTRNAGMLNIMYMYNPLITCSI